MIGRVRRIAAVASALVLIVGCAAAGGAAGESGGVDVASNAPGAPVVTDPGSLGQAILYHLDFATDVDATPIDEGDTFEAGGPRVLTLVGWDYVPAGTELRLRIFQGSRLVYDDTRTTSREDDGGYIFAYQPDGGLVTGAYAAELDYNGVPDEVATFIVVPSGSGTPAAAPSGTVTGPGTPTAGKPILTGPIPYADPAKVLVVTRVAALRQRLGPRTDQVLAAAAKVGTLRDIEADGVSRGTVDAAVAEVQRLLRAGSYRYLLIIGNDDVVPYAHLPNPFADDERDVLDSWDLPSDWVPSDDPYTDLDQDQWIVPDLAIARIPSSDDADLLLKQLGQNVTPEGGAFALLNQKRRSIAEPILNRIDDSVRLERHYAPPTTPDELSRTGAGGARFTYMLLHGIGVATDSWVTDIVAWSPVDLSNLSGEWIVRDGNQQAAFTVDQASAPGGVVEIGACYGAWTLDTIEDPTHKTAANDLALAYLKSGTRAYIADTHISYSAPLLPDGTPVARTGFELLFWQSLLSGSTPIDAFQAAKVGIAKALDQAVAAGDGDSAALDFKTLEIMVYLGRP